jgi:hypothetical protein
MNFAEILYQRTKIRLGISELKWQKQTNTLAARNGVTPGKAFKSRVHIPSLGRDIFHTTD